MNNFDKKAQLRYLAMAGNENQLSPEQLEELERLLLENQDLRQYYVEIITLDLFLQDRPAAAPRNAVPPGAAALPARPSQGPGADAPGTMAPSGFGNPSQHMDSPASRRFTQAITQWGVSGVRLVKSLPPVPMLLVAGVVLGYWVLMATLLIPNAADRPVPQGPSLAHANGPHVARLVAADNCRWEPGSLAPQPGSSLEPAVLQLAEGIAEIHFIDGAQVRLHAPATLELQSASKGFLRSGLLIAQVPSKALGFTVETPTATVVDRGTEFSVNVDGPDLVEVEVLRGLIDVSPKTSGENATFMRLQTGDFARVADGVAQLRTRKPADDSSEGTSQARRARAPRPPVGILAHWNFEGEQREQQGTSKVLRNVIPDASGQNRSLDFWMSDDVTNPNTLRLSPAVPPRAMFQDGLSGGQRSFDCNAMAADRSGVLFLDRRAHPFPQNVLDTFTLEGYFRTDGDQSAAGDMTLLLLDTAQPQFLVELNQGDEGQRNAGALRFSVFGARGPVAAKLSARNYADGHWHYFVATFRPPFGKNKAC